MFAYSQSCDPKPKFLTQIILLLIALTCFLIAIFSSVAALRKGSKVVYISQILAVLSLLVFLLTVGLVAPICKSPYYCQINYFGCGDIRLSSSANQLEIKLTNNVQQPVVITNMSCTKNETQCEKIQDVRIGQQETKTILLNCKDETGKAIKFEQGELFSGRVYLAYYFENEGPTAVRISDGQILVKAQ